MRTIALMLRFTVSIFLWVYRSIFEIPLAILKTAYSKFRRKSFISTYNSDIYLNDNDPFKEIARNGLTTSIFVHGGNDSMSTGSYAAISRIIMAYQEMGRKAISVFVCQDNRYVESQAPKFGIKVIEYPIASDEDILPNILKFYKAVEDNDKIMLYISYRPAENIHVLRERCNDILSALLPVIAGIPGNVCLFSKPYINSNKWMYDILANIKSDCVDLNIQHIIPDDYQFLYRESGQTPNRLLFPEYIYNSKNRIEQVRSVFPDVDIKFIKMNYWDYHHMIYDIEGRQSVHFMEEKEIQS